MGAQQKTLFASPNCRGNVPLDFCSSSNMHESYLILWSRPEILTGFFLTMNVMHTMVCSNTKG